MLSVMPQDEPAELQFIVDTGDVPVAATSGPSGQIDHRGTYQTRTIHLRDQRGAPTSLDVEGYQLVDAPTAVADFHDREALGAEYDPEVRALVSRLTGARRVEVFDYTVRSADENEQASMRLREPLQVAHNDYTERSAPDRVRLALPDEAEALLARRFAIVQVWRATHDPIEVRPLAVCDARSVRRESLLLTERRHRDRIGYIYNLLYDPGQRWVWFPRMHRDEALVFKVFDSDSTRAQFTPHGSPKLRASNPGAPPRRSIEVRTIAFF